jgi:hypothetical protein
MRLRRDKQMGAGARYRTASGLHVVTGTGGLALPVVSKAPLLLGRRNHAEGKLRTEAMNLGVRRMETRT